MEQLDKVERVLCLSVEVPQDHVETSLWGELGWQNLGGLIYYAWTLFSCQGFLTATYLLFFEVWGKIKFIPLH